MNMNSNHTRCTAVHAAAIALVSCWAMTACCAIGPDTIMDDVPGTTTVGNLVSVSTVTNIARTTAAVMASETVTNHVANGYLCTVAGASAMTNAVAEDVVCKRDKTDLTVYDRKWGNFRYVTERDASNARDIHYGEDIPEEYGGGGVWYATCDRNGSTTLCEAYGTRDATALEFIDATTADITLFWTSLVADTNDTLATSNMVLRMIAENPIGTDTNAVKDIAGSASVTNAGAVAAAKAYSEMLRGKTDLKTYSMEWGDFIYSRGVTNARNIRWSSGDEVWFADYTETAEGKTEYAYSEQPSNSTYLVFIGYSDIAFTTRLVQVADGGSIATSNMVNSIVAPLLLRIEALESRIP